MHQKKDSDYFRVPKFWLEGLINQQFHRLLELCSVVYQIKYLQNSLYFWKAGTVLTNRIIFFFYSFFSYDSTCLSAYARKEELLMGCRDGA